MSKQERVDEIFGRLASLLGKGASGVAKGASGVSKGFSRAGDKFDKFSAEHARKKKLKQDDKDAATAFKNVRKRGKKLGKGMSDEEALGLHRERLALARERLARKGFKLTGGSDSQSRGPFGTKARSIGPNGERIRKTIRGTRMKAIQKDNQRRLKRRLSMSSELPDLPDISEGSDFGIRSPRDIFLQQMRRRMAKRRLTMSSELPDLPDVSEVKRKAKGASNVDRTIDPDVDALQGHLNLYQPAPKKSTRSKVTVRAKGDDEGEVTRDGEVVQTNVDDDSATPLNLQKLKRGITTVRKNRSDHFSDEIAGLPPGQKRQKVRDLKNSTKPNSNSRKPGANIVAPRLKAHSAISDLASRDDNEISDTNTIASLTRNAAARYNDDPNDKESKRSEKAQKARARAEDAEAALKLAARNKSYAKNQTAIDAHDDLHKEAPDTASNFQRNVKDGDADKRLNKLIAMQARTAEDDKAFAEKFDAHHAIKKKERLAALRTKRGTSST
jgi:hypothetical protein